MEPGVHFVWAYWPHVIFGIASVFLAITAILSVKGSPLHRRSGQLFALAMGVAAVSAIIFSFVQIAPPALFSAFTVLYGIGMGILSLKRRSGWSRALQWALVAIPLLVALVALVAVGLLFVPQPEAPPMPIPVVVLVAIAASSVGIFFAVLGAKDVGFLRQTDVLRNRRLKRHALRMSVAAAEVVRAPLISFGPALGSDGALSFPVYFFGPFLLIPMIYYFAMPAWVKNGNERRAETLSTALA